MASKSKKKKKPLSLAGKKPQKKTQSSKSSPKAKLAKKNSKLVKKAKPSVKTSGGKLVSLSEVRAKASSKAKAVNLDLTPLDDRLLVERSGFAQKTPGGLYIPDTVADKPFEGRVLAVGRGHRNKKGQVRPMDVKVGDHVIFSQYSGTSVDMEGREVLILREVDILGIVNS